jgi:hypothetical protein
MKRITFLSKLFTLIFFFAGFNVVFSQDINNNLESAQSSKKMNIQRAQNNNQLIILNVQPHMSIAGTYYECWNYNEPDTVSGYISDTTASFSAPADLWLLGTKVGDFYMEFDYIDEPFYIYDVIIPVRTPENLTATLNCNHVTLTWDWEFLGHLPNVNDQFDGFNVYRNDSLLNQEPVQDTFYVDRHVPVGVYDYYVETLFTDGTHSLAYDTVAVAKDYYYGDIVVNTEGMGLEWCLENDVNTPSELNQYELYSDGEFLESTINSFWISFYPPQAPHEFCVVATYVNGCYSKVDCDTLFPAVSNSGISEENLPRFSPNPAQDFIFLDNSDDYDYILITTVRGNKLEKVLIYNGKTPDRIDLQNYHQGVYLLTWFKEGTQQHTQKLIIQK